MKKITGLSVGIIASLGILAGGNVVEAAPFAKDITANGTSYQFQAVQDLLGSVPRAYVEAVTIGAAGGFVGSASESSVPLGQIIRLDELSGGPAEVYAIFDKLGFVRTTTLLAVNETPLQISQPFRGQVRNAYRPVYVGGPTGLYATPEARPSFQFPSPPQQNPEDSFQPSQDVPEPASLILVAIGALGLMKRRDR